MRKIYIDTIGLLRNHPRISFGIILISFVICFVFSLLKIQNDNYIANNPSDESAKAKSQLYFNIAVISGVCLVPIIIVFILDYHYYYNIFKLQEVKERTRSINQETISEPLNRNPSFYTPETPTPPEKDDSKVERDLSSFPKLNLE